jgi:hypothetical protein
LPKNQITPAISVLPWQWEHDFVKVVSFSEGKMKGNKQGNFGKTSLKNFWYASQPASILSQATSPILSYVEQQGRVLGSPSTSDQVVRVENEEMGPRQNQRIRSNDEFDAW